VIGRLCLWREHYVLASLGDNIDFEHLIDIWTVLPSFQYITQFSTNSWFCICIVHCWFVFIGCSIYNTKLYFRTSGWICTKYQIWYRGALVDVINCEQFFVSARGINFVGFWNLPITIGIEGRRSDWCFTDVAFLPAITVWKVILLNSTMTFRRCAGGYFFVIFCSF